MSIIVRGAAPAVERLYLYNYGDECTAATGGWTGYKSASKQQYAVFQTVNAVDTSGYETLHIVVKRSLAGTTTSCGICSGRPSGTVVDNWYTSAVQKVNSDFGLLAPEEWVVSLSDFTISQGYITVGQTGNTNYSSTMNTVKDADHLFAQHILSGTDYNSAIYAVWLERSSGITADYVNREVSAIYTGAQGGANREISTVYRMAGGVLRQVFGPNSVFRDGNFYVPMQLMIASVHSGETASYQMTDVLKVSVTNACNALMITSNPVNLTHAAALKLFVAGYQQNLRNSMNIQLMIFSDIPADRQNDEFHFEDDPAYVGGTGRIYISDGLPNPLQFNMSGLQGSYYIGIDTTNNHDGSGTGSVSYQSLMIE